jgi:hypothetical protein
MFYFVPNLLDFVPDVDNCGDHYIPGVVIGNPVIMYKLGCNKNCLNAGVKEINY